MASLSNKVFNNPDAGIYTNRPAVTAVDTTSTELPTGAHATVDGVPLANTNRVLYTNLSNPLLNNRVYKVSGVGVTITFTVQPDNVPGNIAAVDGNLIFVEQGNTYGETLFTYDGTAWSSITLVTTAVSSLNSLTGSLDLVAGSGVTITPSGSNITISSTGGGGGTPGGTDTAIQINEAGTFGGNSSLIGTSPDYARLLLSGAVDDGASALQLNNSLTFQAGVIGELSEPATTTLSFNEQIILGAAGPTGTVTILFLTGANAGFTTSATGIAFPGGSVPATVYYLDSVPINSPTGINGETFSVNGSGSYNIGTDNEGNFYYPYLVSAKPSSWSNGSASGTFLNGNKSGETTELFFAELPSSIYSIFIPVAQLTTNNPAGTSTELSAVAGTSIDPINRQLIADDASTVNLDWSNPGRVLINGATDDTTSAVQVNGAINIANGKLVINADGSIGVGASQNAVLGAQALGNIALATGEYSTALGYDNNSSAQGALTVGSENTASGTFAIAMGWGSTASFSKTIAMGYSASAGGALGSIAIGISTSAQFTHSLAMLQGANTQQEYGIAIGYGASAGANGVALGFQANGNANYAVAIGSNANAGDDSSIAIGVNSSALGSSISIGVGASSTVANYGMSLGRNTYSNTEYSTVVGNNFNNDQALNDSKAPNGVTLGGMNKITPTANAENWFMVLPGLTANTPRVIIGASVTDDGSSALQPYGAIKLADYTTITVPIEGQLAYNYTSKLPTTYNGTSWV